MMAELIGLADEVDEGGHLLGGGKELLDLLLARRMALHVFGREFLDAAGDFLDLVVDETGVDGDLLERTMIERARGVGKLLHQIQSRETLGLD